MTRSEATPEFRLSTKVPVTTFPVLLKLIEALVGAGVGVSANVVGPPTVWVMFRESREKSLKVKFAVVIGAVPTFRTAISSNRPRLQYLLPRVEGPQVREQSLAAC